MRQIDLQAAIAERQGRICDELIFQYDNLFHVLSVTIRPLSRMQWSSGPTPARTPVRQACHTVWSCDAYATGDWESCRRRFGAPVESLDSEIAVELLPTTEQVCEYIQDTRAHVHDWLGAMSNEALLGPRPDPGGRRRGWTVLGHVLYVLRHGTLHLGYLRDELAARGIRLGGFR